MDAARLSLLPQGKSMLKIYLLALFLLTAFVAGAQENEYVVQSAIGTGSRGDGGLAVDALLEGPYGLAEDQEGNIYISESKAGVIRRVGLDGVIERFAGTGKLASGEEGGKALETDLMRPTTLVIDSDGGLIFADPDACRIRKIYTDGTIHDLVGTGKCYGSSGGFSGGGGNPTGVERALEADIGEVSGMLVDSSNQLLFSDETYHVVRRLDADGYVRLVAGVGAAGYYGDEDKAYKAALHSPRGLAYDRDGNLYVADSGNCSVRRIEPDGDIWTAAGTGTCATASDEFKNGVAEDMDLGSLAGLAYNIDENALYISSPGLARLLRLNLDTGRITGALGNGLRRATDSTSPQEYGVDQPRAVLVSPRAGILVADATSFSVVQLHDGTATQFAGIWPQLDVYPSASAAPLLRPRGLCIQADGSLLAVDSGAERILAFRRPDQLAPVAGVRGPSGTSTGDGGPATEAGIADPDRVLCSPSGDIYVSHGNQIRRISQDGTIATLLKYVRTDSGAALMDDPAGLAMDSARQLIFSEAGANRVVRCDPATLKTTVIVGTGTAGFDGDGGSATEAELDSPGDLAIDSVGNLLIADRGNNRIRRVSPEGTIQTIAGSSGSFSYSDISGELATNIGLGPVQGLAVDAEDNIYLSEDSRISVIDKEGRIRVLAGFVAEDDDGVKSYLHGPLNGCDGLAVDREGRVYFSASERPGDGGDTQKSD